MKQRLTSCVGRMVVWLWIFIIGLVVGGWFGFKAARVYPAVSLPASLGLGQMAPASAQASNGVGLKVENITRAGDRLTLSLTLQNNGLDPVRLNLSEFELMDDQGRRYRADYGPSYFNSPYSGYIVSLNPGLSLRGHFVFALPASAGGLQLLYGNIALPL